MLDEGWVHARVKAETELWRIQKFDGSSVGPFALAMMLPSAATVSAVADLPPGSQPSQGPDKTDTSAEPLCSKNFDNDENGNI